MKRAAARALYFVRTALRGLLASPVTSVVAIGIIPGLAVRLCIHATAQVDVAAQFVARPILARQRRIDLIPCIAPVLVNLARGR